ncbi:hypothetical protein F4813DRAFT_387134 [Daldinia decipiens]|uniref:uncharacterized protein n=1 Tax=Daldinia decipiens TaxID=326647 RepID=UPI0020C22ABD|nr:uncharacterized protein F4813DRAFT_387134 [Daldinia decipiens]KAI1660272.1 hypothetical protein F4813DRAFT_387134 [Daldinia decipiens]
MDPGSGSPSQRIQYKPLDASHNEIRNENSGNLEEAGDVKVQSTTVDSIYALQDLPGKGKGLVAREKISKGTRILSEEAVVTLSASVGSERLRTSICQQVEALSENQRRDFLSMHNIHPYRNTAEQYLGIFRTNSLPVEAVGDKGAIFLEACRINHACDNNAQKNWNENIKRHTVHALKDINKGEEITITYLGPLKNRKTRQKALQEKFHFTCLCHLCSLPPEKSQESDRRLEEIHRLDCVIDQLGTEGVLVSPLRTLRYLDQQVRLYNEQGREDVGFAQAFVNAAQLVVANSDLARGRVFAERAASVWKTTLGGDSAEAIQHGALAQDPSNYELFGISMKWKTKVNETPQGLEPGDFEDWLWKREKPNHPGQLADLRSRTNFPGFIDLPDENGVDPDFYERSNIGTYQPRRHWCFFGEIVDFASILRLQMEIKDVDGTTIPLYFYTDSRGSELAAGQVQKGYTVAILYAERHVFMSGETGIRHENPPLIKIFPLSLDKLLVLNDQIQQFSAEINGMKICHGCGKKAASLQQCGKCLFFWYCNKACQVAGWNEKGHKADCKLLKDPNLRGLVKRNLSEAETTQSGPKRAKNMKGTSKYERSEDENSDYYDERSDYSEGDEKPRRILTFKELQVAYPLPMIRDLKARKLVQDRTPSAAASSNKNKDVAVVYTVAHAKHGPYMGHEFDFLGTYSSLEAANVQVLSFFNAKYQSHLDSDSVLRKGQEVQGDIGACYWIDKNGLLSFCGREEYVEFKINIIKQEVRTNGLVGGRTSILSG